MKVSPLQMMKVVEFEHGMLIVPFYSNIRIQDEKPLMAGSASDCGEYLVRYLRERELGRSFEVAHHNALNGAKIPVVGAPK